MLAALVISGGDDDMSTIERAYALARTGEYATVVQVQKQLRVDGHRAVDALLAPRSIRGHLDAICAASARTYLGRR